MISVLAECVLKFLKEKLMEESIADKEDKELDKRCLWNFGNPIYNCGTCSHWTHTEGRVTGTCSAYDGWRCSSGFRCEKKYKESRHKTEKRMEELGIVSVKTGRIKMNRG